MNKNVAILFILVYYYIIANKQPSMVDGEMDEEIHRT